MKPQFPREHEYAMKQKGKETPYCFQEVRNYQAEQEGVFLALLNKEYTITLEVPQKRSVVSLNYFKIIGFENETETIRFDELLANKLMSMKEEDKRIGLNEGTANRRLEINKIAESIHLLISMLEERKYEMSTTTMGKRNSRASVVELRFDGVTFTKGQIEQKGNKIILCILDRMKNMKRKKILRIEKNDLEFMCLLFS